MLKRYAFAQGGVVATDAPNAPILVFTSPDEAERRYLVEEYKLDEHTLNSALDPDELSRLEFEPEHVAMILKRPKNYSHEDRFLFRVMSMGIFLFKDFVIIVVSEYDPLNDGRPIIRTQTPRELALRLIYRSITHFIDHLRVMNMVSDELEQKISTSMENKFLLSLFTLEKSLVYYLNALSTNGVLVEKLKGNSAKIGFQQEELEYLDDIGVENAQCYKLAEIYSNVVSSVMDARVSIVSNNLNVLMKNLTIITITIMVPTFVVSAFSMNVPMPWGWGDDPLAHYFILGIAGMSALGVTLFWRAKKY